MNSTHSPTPKSIEKSQPLILRMLITTILATPSIAYTLTQTSIASCANTVSGPLAKKDVYLCTGQASITSSTGSTLKLRNITTLTQLTCSSEKSFCLATGGKVIEILYYSSTDKVLKHQDYFYSFPVNSKSSYMDYRCTTHIRNSNYFIAGGSFKYGVHRIYVDRTGLYVHFDMGKNDNGYFSDIYYIPDSKFIAVGGIGAANITILDFTQMSFFQTSKVTSVSGLQKPKMFGFYEKDRSKNWIVVVNDDIRLVKLDTLEILKTVNIEVGPGAYGIRFYPQGDTFVTLTKDAIFFHQVDESNTDLKELHTEVISDSLGVAYDTLSNFMYITKKTGFFRLALGGTPNVCHPNCNGCSNNLDWREDYCTTCEGTVSDEACKKSSTGTVMGGNLISIPTELGGNNTGVVTGEEEENNENNNGEKEEEIQSNMNSLMVLFAIIGAILFLLLIVVFGMVSLIYFLNVRFLLKESYQRNIRSR